MVALYGNFILTGFGIVIHRGKIMMASAGSYILTGLNSTFGIVHLSFIKPKIIKALKSVIPKIIK